MVILAIETSCDETSVAVLKAQKNKLSLLSNVVSSQIDIHKQYGGVVPEIAARHHVQNINPVIMEALEEAKLKPSQIDLLATVSGPGLITSLIVGVEAAKSLSFAWKKPLINVNHMYGHIAGNFLENVKFPAISLIVSGGHTELIHLRSYTNYKKIGQTVDDAAGEAFDKVAKLLELGYPGGPIVSKMATEGNIEAFKFPRPMLNSNDFNFSFSGLKTAVLYAYQKLKVKDEKVVKDICSSFEQAAVDVLVGKTIKAAKKYKVKSVILAGGVAANKRLRLELKENAEKLGYNFYVPEFKLCTDNAAMIAIGAYFLSKKKKVPKDNWKKIKVDPNWELK